MEKGQVKKGIFIVVDIKDDPMGQKHYKLMYALNSLYYPLCSREIYRIDGEK